MLKYLLDTCLFCVCALDGEVEMSRGGREGRIRGMKRKAETASRKILSHTSPGRGRGRRARKKHLSLSPQLFFYYYYTHLHLDFFLSLSFSVPPEGWMKKIPSPGKTDRRKGGKNKASKIHTQEREEGCFFFLFGSLGLLLLPHSLLHEAASESELK